MPSSLRPNREDRIVLSWVVGVPFWAGVIVGVLVTLLLTAIF